MHQAPKQRNVSALTRDTMAIILAGGRGSRLKELTQSRAKPALQFGGKFRIIDFPLSNCINSGIRSISVLTQYMAHSLIRHVAQGWGFLRSEFGEYVDVIPAQQRTGSNWYAGTADAVYQNIDIIRDQNPEYIVILAGDHIYKMDYGEMLAWHVKHNADMTVGCLEVSLEEAKGFGVMAVDTEERVLEFVEKPDEPPTVPGSDDTSLASMGIYVFSTKFLFEQLHIDAEDRNSSHDFGKDIIPRIIAEHRVWSYRFNDPVTGDQAYWRDVGTIDSYWSANIELAEVTPPLNLYDADWPIWTYQAQLPPAKFVFNSDKRRGMAVDSMVSGGCVISGSTIDHSVLFSNVKTHSWSKITDAVILPGVQVGRYAELNKVIIDKGCVIPRRMKIGFDHDEDRARGFHVSPEGVVLVTQAMLAELQDDVG
jgi:glucose-1-phosphate adenylyltransferase